MQDNPTVKKLPRNLGMHQFTIDGVTESRGVSQLYNMLEILVRVLIDNLPNIMVKCSLI